MSVRNISFILLIYLVSGHGLFASDKVRETEYEKDLTSGPSADEVIWIGEDDQRFLALYRATEKLPIKGTAILLHQMGSHPDSDPLIYALRHDLSRHNWATVAIQLPLREADVTEPEYYQLFPEAKRRISKAVSHLAENGAVSMVLVGHQLGALMGLYAQATEPMPEIGAMVNIGLPVPESENKYAQTLKLLKSVDIPFLDLYGGKDSINVVSSARDRRIAAQNNRYFRQVKLNNAGTPYWNDQELIVKRVYSWLNRINKK